MADYYKTLGINKNASPEEIKKAFRELAHKHHPDKSGGDATKFKEVSEAYQTLSDPEKRKMYDQYGDSFQQAQSRGGFSGFDNFRDWAAYAEAMKNNSGGASQDFDFGDLGGLGDIFGDLFGGGGSRRTSSRGGRKRSGRDIEVEIAIDFREAIFGAEKEISLDKNTICEKCNGSGVEPGSKINTCSHCRGSGQVAQRQSTFFGTIQTVGVCPACQGEGAIADKKCSHCRGEGRSRKIEKIKIKIPAGVNEGGIIKLRGYGEAGQKGGPAGDLYIHLHIRADKHFKREEDNLYSKEDISITQAVLGGQINVETVDGEVDLKVPAGTKSGQEFRLTGKGVPILNGHGRGDQIVRVEINIPKRLNRQQKELFEKLQKEDL